MFPGFYNVEVKFQSNIFNVCEGKDGFWERNLAKEGRREGRFEGRMNERREGRSIERRDERSMDRRDGRSMDRRDARTGKKDFHYLVKTNLNLIFCFEKKKTVDTQSWKIGTTTIATTLGTTTTTA